jgi:hypothetical protein
LQSFIIGVSIGIAALFFAAAIVLMIGLAAERALDQFCRPRRLLGTQ